MNHLRTAWYLLIFSTATVCPVAALVTGEWRLLVPALPALWILRRYFTT